ncbi:uncharacterized protein LOC144444341 [Glandiceps talaboti]
MGGVSTVQNVLMCVKRARKIVIVLSKAFVKSSWCEYELVLSLDEHFSREQDILVPICLEECAIPDSIAPLNILDTKDPYFWRRFLCSLRPDYADFKKKCASSIVKHGFLQDGDERSGPNLKLISAPENPVTTGFHTPHYPHPKSDHCIVLGVQEYEHTDDVIHCDFTDKECEFSIKLLDVKLTQEQTSKPLTWGQTQNGSNSPTLTSSKFYRVWDGIDNSLSTGGVVELSQWLTKPWMHPYWFRFFGKSREFELSFGLYKRGESGEHVDLVDSLTLQIATRGKKPTKGKQESYNTRVMQMVPLIECKGLFDKRIYKTIVNSLFDMHAKGYWQEIDQCCTNIYEYFEEKSTDFQILALCYQCGANSTHENNLQTIKQIAQKAKNLLPMAENRELLEAKINLHLGYAYRKNGKLGKAQEYIESAYQGMMLVRPCSFRGECLYNLTCINYDTLKGQTTPPESLLQNLLSELDRSIDLMTSDSKMTVYVRQRAMIKKIQMLANKASFVDKERLGPGLHDKQSIEDAKQLLQHIEFDEEFRQYSSFNYHECCLMQCKVYIYIGMQMYDMARQQATLALQMAEDNEFNQETKMIRRLINNIPACGGAVQIPPTAKGAVEAINDCIFDGYRADSSTESDES